METAISKRRLPGVAPIIALCALLFFSLYLMSDATQNSEQFGRLYSWLLILNALGVVILVTLIVRNVYRLVTHYRAGVVGSRMTVRLVVMFVLLAVLPVSVVYYFSLGFLHRGIDSWFDVRIEGALQDALDLSRSALDGRMREFLRETQEMAVILADVPDDAVALQLDELRSRSGAAEVTMLTPGRIVAFSGPDQTEIVPNRPDDSVLSHVRQSEPYVRLEPIDDEGLHVRVVVRVPIADARADLHALQALYPVAERQSTLAANVQDAYGKYNELVYLRKPLKYSFTLTLSLVLLLALLTAVWAALVSARRMAAPIRDLAEGTRAVAAGDYSARLPHPVVSDELGFLVRSFNDMTEKIALARDDVKRSQQQAEAQRAYLETLLGRLSSGVLSMDSLGKLRIVNAAASQILGLDLESMLNLSFDQMDEQHPHLTPLVDAIAHHMASDAQEWREEITLLGASGRQVLMCRGAVLPGGGERAGGFVIVFDDVTQLIQAQRNAAWGEVARRMAHEIKNPLTPIQLSAERLRHKYLKRMEPEAAEVLDRSTHTIVQQVEQMKQMVNAFSEYARAPKLKLESLDLNKLVTEVLELYRGHGQAVRIRVDLYPAVPPIKGDDGRMRQVMHNLVKNAIEALEGTEDPCVTISTRCAEYAACRFVELTVEDNGPGIPDEILGQIFEPYVTSKSKGSGLGLAIVKRIVEEHSGVLAIESPPQGGTRFVVRLPVIEISGTSEVGAETGGRKGRALTT